ncbi:MAG: carboxypeptidase-like regulatory domain-containing protein [Prevotella sp.]|nr:carboxypeptidase-like regulatory domain-containing protein [Prevotella sp.]
MRGRQKLSLLVLLLLCGQMLQAQITGRVIDDATEEPVPMATLIYKNLGVGTKADAQGRFTLARHNHERLVISCVGYETQEKAIRQGTPSQLTIRMKPNQLSLGEVTVTSRRSSRYRRKNNPAVELMRKVIAAKKQTDLRQKDYYRYANYQKLMVGLNDLKPKDFQSGLLANKPWIIDHLELCPYNNKLIMPLSLEETVTERSFRRDPHESSNNQLAHRITGLTNLFQTGDLVNLVSQEYFNDVDIYQDNIRLLRHPFTSPIGRDAILFYHFYITDTTYVDNDKCYVLDFTPSTQQDFGFRGQLFVMADSSYLVKRCTLSLPNVTGVNWVEGLYCQQEFSRLEGGEWVLTRDDMVAEMAVTDFTAKLIVVRNTARSHFEFEDVTDPTPSLESREADTSSAAFEEFRPAPLTSSESSLGLLVERIEGTRGFKYLLAAMKALFENYIETGSKDQPSKVDIGPVLSSISSNFNDGLRLRIGGQTTAALHPHLFLKGYYAHAMKSHENYYDGTLTYAFSHPKYLPHEFPARTISFQSRRDVALPSDKYLDTDKDNVFSALKISEIDKMLLYNSQTLTAEYEQKSGLRLAAQLKTEKVNPIGNMTFTPLTPLSTPLSSLRYSEATFSLRFSPGETILETKERRRTLHYNAPVVRLQHTVGLKGFLGGQYNYNYTELEAWKRFWMPMSFGAMKLRLRMGAQWNRVPFPLLIMPETNMAYFLKSNSFDLINNMEFLNDRFVSLQMGWDLNGKLFNLVPLLKRLKWREYIGVQCLWGKLTDKNNPLLAENSASGVLMYFPEGSYAMDGKQPYWEVAFGIHNILKLITVEYIRRLNYLDLPTAQKQVVKMAMEFKF